MMFPNIGHRGELPPSFCSECCRWTTLSFFLFTTTCSFQTNIFWREEGVWVRVRAPRKKRLARQAPQPETAAPCCQAPCGRWDPQGPLWKLHGWNKRQFLIQITPDTLHGEGGGIQRSVHARRNYLAWGMGGSQGGRKRKIEYMYMNMYLACQDLGMPRPWHANYLACQVP